MRGTLLERLKALPPEKLAQLKHETASESVSGHALLAEALQGCGIKRVYGVSGTPVDQIFAECAARGIRPLSTVTQQAAVLMAAAGNYLAGRLEAAVVVSSGPGVTNTVTGVLVARENGWPVLVVGGRRALLHEGIGYFQELDAVPILRPVTKMAMTITKTSAIRNDVAHAVATATASRRGPVYLDLPEDILEGRAARDEASLPKPILESEIDREKVGEAGRIIARAKRPLLILGEDIRWSFLAESLRELVDEFGIPFITSPMGRGFLSDNHPLCANEFRTSIQGEADVVVLAGAWFDWRFRFGTTLGARARVIHADADPATLGKNVAGALTILGEPGEFLTHLAEALLPSMGRDRFADWHESLGQRRRAFRSSQAAWLQQKRSPMLPQELYLSLRDVLPSDAIIAVEGNISLAAAQKILQASRPASWLDPGRNGIIGAAIHFAMGAKLACPDRTVVALCSDTGFGMSAMDLEAAVRHHIPIIVVIANNDGNSGSVRQKNFFPADYPERFTEFLPGLRYERIMALFGGHAEYITEAAEIRPAFERALAAAVPACLNVQLDSHAPHSGFW
ncbi:MAG: thiamine pyrophosphate-binding protein [Verrucomicrobiota bacterium]|nr:thiamine pyrophosphate-binding protein [Verrucomicrobiota bacterium]